MTRETSVPSTAVVTGGGGGIGSRISARLASEGYTVVVADSDADAAQRTAAGLPSLRGASHLAYHGDLTSSEVNRDLAHAAHDLGPVAVLVNAIGISPKRAGHKIAFHEVTDEDWFNVMAVNVAAPFFLVRESHKFMPTDGTASIVNILSITARMGTGGPEGAAFFPQFPSSVAYGASKGALHNLTISLAHELAPHRIRVNGVAPGFVSTPMLASTGTDEVFATQVPMQRYARPEEIADAVEFLTSARASYVTGACIDVNGGFWTS